MILAAAAADADADGWLKRSCRCQRFRRRRYFGADSATLTLVIVLLPHDNMSPFFTPRFHAPGFTPDAA